MNTTATASSSEHLPEGAWTVLCDLKVPEAGQKTITTTTGDELLPLWLKDRFLLGATPQSECAVVSLSLSGKGKHSFILPYSALLPREYHPHSIGELLQQPHVPTKEVRDADGLL